MSIREEVFATVEAALQTLPESFWFYVGGGKNADWERMTREELVDMAKDDAEEDRDEGIRPTLDQPAQFVWLDEENGRIGTEDDPTLYEFSTAATPSLLED
ncbi:MAG: hypothetical protein H7338_13680 [Candidatus Sericytochromatia bacterium]|nr:hypothetical protein [Candidatus Sericytochromatia bacterium]